MLPDVSFYFFALNLYLTRDRLARDLNGPERAWWEKY
jgi:hypothetical protein